MFLRATSLATDFGESDEGGLGSGIVGLSGVAGNADDGGHVDDAAASLSDHGGQDGLDAEEGPP